MFHTKYYIYIKEKALKLASPRSHCQFPLIVCGLVKSFHDFISLLGIYIIYANCCYDEIIGLMHTEMSKCNHNFLFNDGTFLTVVTIMKLKFFYMLFVINH